MLFCSPENARLYDFLESCLRHKSEVRNFCRDLISLFVEVFDLNGSHVKKLSNIEDG